MLHASGGRSDVKIVGGGGSGLIGAKLATELLERGHQVVVTSRSSGVDTMTGEGRAAALAGTHLPSILRA
jgi:nucleoside-diphosphate-sugar epimerase